jgi:hypothetical protein
MKQAVTKTVFGTPSLQTARRVDDHDNSLAVRGAVYRAEAKLSDLRLQYEDECSRVRTAMLAEIAGLELGEQG